MLVSNPKQRATAVELLHDPFIRNISASDCLLPLIQKPKKNLEYKETKLTEPQFQNQHFHHAFNQQIKYSY